jgi:DNA-binding transcriptional MerR regulator
MHGFDSKELERTYTLADLSELTELAPRKVRYYQTRKLLPTSTVKGKSKYDDQHLATLLVIKALRDEGLSLKTIQQYLGAGGEAGADEEAPGAMVIDEVVERLKATAGRPRSERLRDMTHSVLGAGPALISKVLSAFKKAPASPLSAGGGAKGGGEAPQRSTWERIAVSSQIELHVKRPLSSEQNKDLAKLLETAQDLFGDADS